MKRKAIVALVLFVAVVGAGCTQRARPAVPTADVAVIMPDEEVTASYKVLRTIKKMADVETPDSVLVGLARAEAASIGAEALLVRELREYEEGRVDARRSVRQKRLIGDAIYFTSERE
jgi:hypothetical protein